MFANYIVGIVSKCYEMKNCDLHCNDTGHVCVEETENCWKCVKDYTVVTTVVLVIITAILITLACIAACCCYFYRAPPTIIVAPAPFQQPVVMADGQPVILASQPVRYVVPVKRR